MVLDEAVEEKAGGERVRLGMVVIRGNSVVMLEVCRRPSPHVEGYWTNDLLLQALERIGGDRDR